MIFSSIAVASLPSRMNMEMSVEMHWQGPQSVEFNDTVHWMFKHCSQVSTLLMGLLLSRSDTIFMVTLQDLTHIQASQGME